LLASLASLLLGGLPYVLAFGSGFGLRLLQELIVGRYERRVAKILSGEILYTWEE
jgi:hypothetical protein